MKTITINQEIYRLVQFFDDEGQEVDAERATAVLCQRIDVFHDDDNQYIVFGLARRVQ